MESFFFLIFAVVAVASAIGVVLLKNPVHCAVSLMACFIQVAAVFVLLRSPFLAVVQIFVYVGAIMVLFVFVIMMLDIRKVKLERFVPGNSGLMLVIVTALGLQMIAMLMGSKKLITPPDNITNTINGSVSEIGLSIFSDYLLPFEVVSVLMLVAFIGAIVLAKNERQGQK